MQVLGFRVLEFEFMASGVGFRILEFGFMAFVVLDFGLIGPGFWVPEFGLMASGAGFRVEVRGEG